VGRFLSGPPIPPRPAVGFSTLSLGPSPAKSQEKQDAGKAARFSRVADALVAPAVLPPVL
jgi:hypothetical protein